MRELRTSGSVGGPAGNRWVYPTVEGLASYGGPESCVNSRKGVGEALTGVRVRAGY